METGRVGERKVGEPSRIRSKRPATDTNDDPVDPVDGLFRTDATIPAPRVEDVPSEVEISRWEAAAHEALFSEQPARPDDVDRSVPPPPPAPLGHGDVRKSLDALPPVVARREPDELDDELHVDAPAASRDELDTSRPPPMKTSDAEESAPGVAELDTSRPPPPEATHAAENAGEVLELDADLLIEDAVSDQAVVSAAVAPAPDVAQAGTRSTGSRYFVFGLAGVAIVAVVAAGAMSLFAPESSTNLLEGPPAPAPVAKTVSLTAVKASAPAVASIAVKPEVPLEAKPPATAGTKPVAPLAVKAAVVATKTAALPVTPTPPIQPSARPVRERTKLPAAVVPVVPAATKQRPVREAAPITPAPARAAEATISTSEAAQTVTAARRKLADDDAEGAEELMRQLLQNDPHNDQALDVLVRALIDQDRGGAAAAAAEKLVALRPRSVPALLLLGDALLMKGDEAKAKAAWQKALDLKPGDAGAMQRLGL